VVVVEKQKIVRGFKGQAMTDNAKLIQGSPEWHEARIGKITGSRFKDVLSKGGGVTRAKYMRDLLLERKTGICVDGYYDKNMAKGQVVEPQARTYYEKVNNAGSDIYGSVKVEQVGFIDHPLEQYKGYVGISPDGLIGIDGGLEIKCPTVKVHLEYIAKNVMPSQYVAQVQGNMWITGRQWWDFESFCPEVKAEPFWCIRVNRDQAYINKLASAVDIFIQEMVEMQKNQVEVDPQLLIDVTEGGCSELEWQVKLQNEIRGKIRHGLSCAYMSGTPIDMLPANPTDELKRTINLWVDFIVTGE